MSIRNSAAIVATACMGACILGCGAAPASETDDALISPGGGEVDESAAAIRGGIEPAGGSGAVIVGARCTGVLIGTGMVLTSAHCFDAKLGSAASGWVNDAVSYVSNGNFYRCISNPTPNSGKCTREVPMYVTRYSTTFADWPSKDIAMMFMGTGGEEFFHVVPADAADGIYDGAIPVGARYILHGQGANTNAGVTAGVMRYMRGTVNTVFAQAFNSVMSNVAVCAGDSGGPYMQDGSQWVFGLQSAGGPVSPGGNNCVEPGGTAVAARITSAARQWINANRISNNQPACAPFSANFPRHWICP